MKNRVLICIGVVGIMISAIAGSVLNAQEKFPFKSAVIKYKISGDAQNGEQEIYIDNYGKKRCTIMDVSMSMGGFNTTTHSMMISDGNDLYNIDLSKKTGTKTTISPEQREQMMAMAKQMMPTPEEMEKSWNKVGTEDILGKSCNIYEGQGMKAWIWKGIILKSEVDLMGKYVMEATSLDIDASVPAGQFEPPSDVTITEQEMPAGFGFMEE